MCPEIEGILPSSVELGSPTSTVESVNVKARAWPMLMVLSEGEKGEGTPDRLATSHR